MLTRVEIDNYKSIGHTDLTFSEETVVVGPNGVGKSNLLDAIHFLRDATVEGLDHAVTKRHGITSIRRWSKTRPYNIILKLHFCSGEDRGYYRVVISSSGGEFSILEEEAFWHGTNPMRPQADGKPVKEDFRFVRKNGKAPEFDIPNNPFALNYRYTPPQAELAISQMGRSGSSAYSLFFMGLHKELSSCGAYSIYPNRIREPQSISNADVLADDGSNLASIIRQMRSTSHRNSKESLTSAMRQVLPILSEIRIESAGGFFVPVFRVREADKGPSHDLNMSQLSDGTLRMLGMLTAFYQPMAPNRITLEEPEQMIHPGLLPVLIESSKDFLALNDDRQTFFTTHSPTFLDFFEVENIISAQNIGGSTTFNAMAPRQIKLVKDRLFTSGELLIAEGIMS